MNPRSSSFVYWDVHQKMYSLEDFRFSSLKPFHKETVQWLLSKKQISHIFGKGTTSSNVFCQGICYTLRKLTVYPVCPWKNDGWKTIFASEMFPFQVPFVHFREGSSMKATLSSTSSRCLTPWPPVPGYCSRSSLWPCHWQSCPKDY